MNQPKKTLQTMGAGFLVQFESLYKSTETGDENDDLGAGMGVLPFARLSTKCG